MFQKLFDTVPNITPERSALGGFSNGGHAVGVLLAGQDEFILSHFRAFYLAEGGFGPLAANALRKIAMKPCRFLLLRGDQPDDDSAKSKEEREHNTHLAQALELEAQEFHLDFTAVTMQNTGHDLPRKYQAILGAWVRGESISQTDEKK
jgi:predicted esterase